MIKRFLIAVCVLSVATGCRPFELYFIKPQGPPEYQLGWQDGCDTGLSAGGGMYQYPLLYSFKKRPELGNSEQYKTGWNEGFTYCRFNVDANKPLRPEWEDVDPTKWW